MTDRLKEELRAEARQAGDVYALPVDEFASWRAIDRITQLEAEVERTQRELDTRILAERKAARDATSDTEQMIAMTRADALEKLAAALHQGDRKP